MYNNSNESDLLIMLISSDWFSLYFDLFFAESTPEEKAKIQSISRDFVKSIMGNAKSYWDVTFTPERIIATKNAFLFQVKKAISSNVLRNNIDNYFSSVDKENSIFSFCWLVTENVSAGLSKEYVPLKDERLLSYISQQKSAIEDIENDIDFEEKALDSNTEWDRFLRSITQDQPTYLSDFLFNFIDRYRFNVFLGVVSKKLSTEDFEKILEWYVANIELHIGKNEAFAIRSITSRGEGK